MFDLIRCQHPYLHLREPGNDFPLICLNRCFNGWKTSPAAVDRVERFEALLRFWDDHIRFFLDHEPGCGLEERRAGKRHIASDDGNHGTRSGSNGSVESAQGAPAWFQVRKEG